VKTSLDAQDIKESNELDKNIRLHFKALGKIYICAFSVVIF